MIAELFLLTLQRWKLLDFHDHGSNKITISKNGDRLCQRLKKFITPITICIETLNIFIVNGVSLNQHTSLGDLEGMSQRAAPLIRFFSEGVQNPKEHRHSSLSKKCGCCNLSQVANNKKYCNCKPTKYFAMVAVLSGESNISKTPLPYQNSHRKCHGSFCHNASCRSHNGHVLKVCGKYYRSLLNIERDEVSIQGGPKC